MQFTEFTENANKLYSTLLRSPTGVEITLRGVPLADAVVSEAPKNALRVGASWVGPRRREIRDALLLGRPVAISWSGKPYAVLVPRANPPMEVVCVSHDRGGLALTVDVDGACFGTAEAVIEGVKS